MPLRPHFTLSGALLLGTIVTFALFITVLFADGVQLAKFMQGSMSGEMAASTLYDLEWLDKNGQIVDDLDSGSNYDDVLKNFGVSTSSAAPTPSAPGPSSLCCYSESMCTPLTEKGAVEEGVLGCIQKHGLIVQCSDSACSVPLEEAAAEPEPEALPAEVQPEEVMPIVEEEVMPIEEEQAPAEEEEVSSEPAQEEEHVEEEAPAEEEYVEEEQTSSEPSEEVQEEMPTSPEMTDMPWWHFFFPWFFN